MDFESPLHQLASEVYSRRDCRLQDHHPGVLHGWQDRDGSAADQQNVCFVHPVEFKSWPYRTSTGEEVKLNIWDTAGQERFRSVSKAYFRNAVGALLVDSIDSGQSYGDLNGWLSDLRQFANPSAVILLVGNKRDLDAREVSEEQRDIGEGRDRDRGRVCAARQPDHGEGEARRNLSAGHPGPDASNLQSAKDRAADAQTKEWSCC
jgi:hypothetical protein